MLGFLSHIEYHMRQIWVSKDLKKGEHNFKFEASAEDAHFTELSVLVSQLTWGIICKLSCFWWAIQEKKPTLKSISETHG